MELTLSGWTQGALVVIAVVNVLLLGVLVGAVFGIMKALQKLREQVNPLIERTKPIMDRVPPIMDEAKTVVANVNPVINEQVKPIMGNVQEITVKVSGMVSDLSQHAHEIAETGEQTVKHLTTRVEAAGDVVTDTVSKPVISVASVIAGVSRAFSVLKNYQKSSQDPPHPPHANGNGRSTEEGITITPGTS
ncbi:MAG: hypothetical protein KY468_14085 [Armatimonadetes bacterium]|nr:hypothetical protein [Armatimonadota bacterium]